MHESAICTWQRVGERGHKVQLTPAGKPLLRSRRAHHNGKALADGGVVACVVSELVGAVLDVLVVNDAREVVVALGLGGRDAVRVLHATLASSLVTPVRGETW